MRSLLPLSLFLTVLDVLHTVRAVVPFEVITSNNPPAHRLGRRAVPISNNGNAAYMANITLGGVGVSVILDTGSSDLWVSFPGTPPTTTDTGKSISLNYAVGSASGTIHKAELKFDNYTVPDQAFLQVADSSSFSTNSAFNGLVGLGPSDGSAILDKIKGNAGETMLSRIFQQNKTSSNYITFLLDRKNDPSASFTGQFTIAETVKGLENITSQTKLNVETVHRLLDDQQHWQAITDKDSVIGPDGTTLAIKSIVPKAPKGQLVAVFDSGFTFSQVPRELSDAIYGRVQGAVYDAKNEWWTVPCAQELNVTFHFGGVAFPMHPLDVVDDNFKILDTAGNRVCIGAFQPITSAFSLFGNFDMIMGMTFLRNAYTLMDYGEWIERTSNDRGDPFMQLLPLTNRATAHADFVKVRLNGVDTTGSSQFALLPASQQQHSPVSAEEKKKKYEEMILSRWPYIVTGSLVGFILLVGFIIWRCCCRNRRAKKKASAKGFFEPKSETYLPLQVHGQGSPPATSSPYQHHQQESQQSLNSQQAAYNHNPQYSQQNFHQPPPSQYYQQGYPQQGYQQQGYQQQQQGYGYAS
ncbi:Aspartic peptidase A1 [Mycena indigotica]|uniref:Aspartic peptidase A1 n=1 Tax=Mycena indigotica TaxID=2126181 RepID=A0A8H6SFR7_9AGAR|nr:Aspartic peptidase A1 [Mycena indigotica]KAF7298775.1 Aspartic peptidase A1 [Mycena indigotica]